MDRPDAPLCDVRNARTSRELFVKLFVMNFTVVGSYAHLLYLRKEQGIKRRLCIFVCRPHLVLVDIVALWIILPVVALLCRSSIEDLRSDVGALIGELPPLDATSTRGALSVAKFSWKICRK